MTRKERYRLDAEYRAEVNKRNREQYHKNIGRPEYARLVALRARIFNARTSLRHHEERAAFFMKRLERDLNAIEKLKSKKLKGE